jgi:uncharacterized protein
MGRRHDYAMVDDDTPALIRAHIAADGALHVKVTPGADRNGVASGVDVNGRPVLLVRLRAKAVDGAANKGLLAYLAKELGAPKSRIMVEQGTNSRQKRLRFIV